MILYPTPSLPGLAEAMQAAALHSLAYGGVPSVEPDRPQARVKPRIRRVFNHGIPGFEWQCSDRSECYAIGWGATREAAYEQWLARFAHCRRSRAQ